MPFVLEGHEKWRSQRVASSNRCPVASQTASSCAKQCPATGNTEAPAEPFQTLYPIMARLPDDCAQETWESKKSRFGDDYFSPDPNTFIPGALEFDQKHPNVRYTQSRLPSIDAGGKALWTALHRFHPLTSSYAGNFQSRSRAHKRRESDIQASCPMKQSSSSSLDLVRRVFNWDDLVLPESTEAAFYGVIFRSKRAANSDDETPALMAADKLSHEEAVASGGLLMYWYGVPDPETGSNLATCIWQSRDEARKASALPLHRLAVKHAARAYEDFELSRYKVVKRAGECGVCIEEWNN